MARPSKALWHANTKKTRCPQGHVYAGENLIIESSGGRRCRICKSVRAKGTNTRRYGISVEEKQKLLLQQKQRCAICGQRKQLVIDHSHKSNKVRGLLCTQCNLALGLLKDDVYNVLMLLAYLENQNGASIKSSFKIH